MQYRTSSETSQAANEREKLAERIQKLLRLAGNNPSEREAAAAMERAYRRQSWRLALLVRQGALDRAAAVDRLWEIAIAHTLVRALGEGRVQAILDEAFADADFRPLHAEVA